MSYNHKHTNWIWRTFLAYNEVGLQIIHGFSRMQNLGSRREFILRSPFPFNFHLLLICQNHIRHLAQATTHTRLYSFLKLSFSSFFYFSSLWLLLLYTIFCACCFSYHNPDHPIHSPKFGTNLSWSTMLSYNLRKGKWRL